MLLKIYLVTTAINYGAITLQTLALKKKIKREGYEFIRKEKPSVSESILDFLKTIATASIPIYNAINVAAIILGGEKLRELTIAELIETGKIRKKSDYAYENEIFVEGRVVERTEYNNDISKEQPVVNNSVSKASELRTVIDNLESEKENLLATEENGEAKVFSKVPKSQPRINYQDK